MKKKDFVSLILSTIGGIVFALGMCMALIPEWGAMGPGIVIGIVGLVILGGMVMVRRKMDGKPAIVINGRAIGISLFGAVGACIFGVGMCLTMIWGHMALGIVVGCVGLVLLLALIPMVKGFDRLRKEDA